MANHDLDAARQSFARCTDDELRALLGELRARFPIHELEIVFGAPAEVILEAIHRAPELTRRMLRGVIADAAFAKYVVPCLATNGWKDATPEGNFSFDHVLEDSNGPISVQVKLQRSESGRPVVTSGTKFGLAAGMYMVESQRTRGGKRRGDIDDGTDNRDTKTRPYRYGEFDVLAVSLQPSTQHWSSFRYTVSTWLLPGRGLNEIATYQPVSMTPNADWTDDFSTIAQWFRSSAKKRIGGAR